jgi:hypothetical protein
LKFILPTIYQEDGYEARKWVYNFYKIVDRIKTRNIANTNGWSGEIFFIDNHLSEDERLLSCRTLHFSSYLTNRRLNDSGPDVCIQLSASSCILFPSDRVETSLREEERLNIIHHIILWSNLPRDLVKIVATYLSRGMILNDVKIECVLEKNTF